MGPTWGPSGADRTQVGPMLAPSTLLSGSILNMTVIIFWTQSFISILIQLSICLTVLLLNMSDLSHLPCVHAKSYRLPHCGIFFVYWTKTIYQDTQSKHSTTHLWRHYVGSLCEFKGFSMFYVIVVLYMIFCVLLKSKSTVSCIQ